MLTDDVRTLLLAALPPSVPVLLPEQILTPAGWQEEDAAGDLLPGGERGLHVYLRQKAPDGYVQVEGPIGVGVNDYAARWWVAAAALGATPAQAGVLAEQIRRALTGRPDEPGPATRVLADAPQSIGTASVCRATYEFTELDGNPVIQE